ncbi:metallophosphoesterase [Elizabethkingia meningoseptica]|uniref:metallophosphoesterase n=1 Tax=Elizabethkingia meningoseptica TaxID=238 RepID=UPI0038928DC6
MNVLHISDLHFVSLEKSEYTIKKVVEKISEKAADKEIDFIFFTGDLVNRGDCLKDFYTANSLLFDELSSKLQVKKSNILFCCGNHDVWRNQEMGIVTEMISKISNEWDLENFITAEVSKKEYKNSLLNIQNFMSFQNEYFEGEESVNEIEDLYAIHTRESNGKIIKIVSINSSWRCNDSEKDYGNLLFPNKLMENISLKIKNSDFNILLIHHPLGEFKYWNRTLIENKIYEDFHLMLLGHVHKGIQTSIAKDDEGIITSSSTAVLSSINDYEKMGFSIIKIDIDLRKIKFSNFNLDSEFVVYQSQEHIIDIPISGLKQEYVELRKKVTRLYELELETGKDLFLNNIKGSKGFFEKFSTPVLKNLSTAEIKDVKNSSSNRNIFIDSLFDDIQSSKVIYGKDKYGKTIILFYLYLKFLINFSSRKVLPIYVDIDSDNGKGGFSIQKHFKRLYSLTNENFDFAVKNYQIILLVDDFSKVTQRVKEEIELFISEYPKTVVYVTDDESILQHSQIVLDSIKFEKVFIHELSSVEVRELTKSSLNCSDETNANLLYKIKTLFTQLNLNFNFWTISLFIYIFNSSENSIFRNNFELLELYIDNLLEKEKIISEKSLKIKYQQLKDFLSSLAHHLVTSKSDAIYHLSYREIIDFIEEYKRTHSRFVIGTEELCSMIINKGIIKHNKNDDNYSFRLKGVFEYFIAMYMSNNSDFTNAVLSNRELYLSFGNEVELYAGFKQKDEGFARDILSITREYYSELEEIYTGSNTDYNLVSKVKEIKLIDNKSLKLGIKNQLEKNSVGIVDELVDRKAMNQNVTLKEFKQVIKNAEQLEKALFILSRVYRNTEFSDQELENEILDFILESACNLSFLIIDENNNTEEGNETLLGIFKNFAPLIVQNFLFDAMAQESLQQIFERKIEELKQKGNEELKLFVLYFILVDLDFNTNKKYINELTSIVKVNIIKFGVLYKLYNYLIFNKTSDKEFLRKSVLDQQKRIDNSRRALEDAQKRFSSLEKISLTNKLKDKQ